MTVLATIKDVIVEGKHGARGGDIESLTEQELNDLVEFVSHFRYTIPKMSRQSQSRDLLRSDPAISGPASQPVVRCGPPVWSLARKMSRSGIVRRCGPEETIGQSVLVRSPAGADVEQLLCSDDAAEQLVATRLPSCPIRSCTATCSATFD